MNPMHKITTLNPTKHAVTLLDEFKTFAFKGNVIDLAVGVIIGAAFGKIVEVPSTSGSRSARLRR